MFEIFEYMRNQIEKEKRKKARREAVKKFFEGFFLSVLLSLVVCGVFALVGYIWFMYITEPTSWHLTGAIVISVFIFVIMVSVMLCAWYSGDDEDVD